MVANPNEAALVRTSILHLSSLKDRLYRSNNVWSNVPPDFRRIRGTTFHLTSSRFPVSTADF